MKTKRFLSMLLTAVMVTSTVTFVPETNTVEAAEAMRDITTMELTRDMGLGINLGNTYESCGDWIAQYGDGTPNAYVTAWGSPVITQQMIQGYANEGFGVVRIPVAWSNMIGDNYQINDAYMESVTNVVDWTLDAGMYAIINLHWDGGWFEAFPTNKDECMRRYEVMWTQISENFEDYGDHLVFESQNEELGWDSLWSRYDSTTDGKAESYNLANEINQTFVDLIRNSGGNNSERHLLISGYKTDIELTCDPLFQMPDDPMNRCAVSVHYYTPADFAILTQDADWGKARSTWGTDADYAELNRNMDMMKTTFIDKGIPVIFGEYGCPSENKDPNSVRLFLSETCRAIYERNMVPVLWDITGFQYDRTNYRMYDDQLKALYHEILADGGANTEPEKPSSLNGNLIKNLVVMDTENATDWKIDNSIQTGELVFGDREVTYTLLTEQLLGAEAIQTACDSKNYGDNLASFTAAADMTVYVALDSRVTTAPTWLSSWQLTNLRAESSNDVTYKIYCLEVKQGETVILGTNGQSSGCVGYTVFASLRGYTEAIIGDANADGSFSIADVVMLQKWLIRTSDATLTDWQAADLCEDGKLDVFDLCIMKRKLIEKQ